MSFKNRDFLKTQFVPREETLTLKALAAWFSEEPAWTVRGLTACEIALAENAIVKNQQISSIVDVVAKYNDSKTEELKEILGLTDNTPAVIAKRLEHLVIASVNPVIELSVAVKLAEVFPIEFLLLTNKITELTGLGQDVKKL